MLRNTFVAVREAGQLLRPTVRGSPCYNVQQTRTTVVVERMFAPPLGKKGQMPPLKKKHNVLKMVERVHAAPTPKISCILTQYVKGLGMKGDVVEVKRSQFRNALYPAKMAIYASPENLAELEQEGGKEEGPKMTAYGQLTLQQLKVLHMRIPMNGDKTWILNKTNVKVALRKMGIEAKETCITMPREAITEPQEITVGITINHQETVYVKGTVYNVYKDTRRNILPDFPPVWSRRKRRTEKVDT